MEGNNQIPARAVLAVLLLLKLLLFTTACTMTTKTPPSRDVATTAVTNKSEPEAVRKAKAVTSSIPPDEQRRIGRIAAAEVMRRFALVQEKALLMYVNRVGQYVSLHIGAKDNKIQCIGRRPKLRPSNGYRIAIVRGDKPISFSAPGGFVFLTTSLINDLRSEDQLAGVLAHEMFHSMCGASLPPDPITEGHVDVPIWVDEIVARPYTRAQLLWADRGTLIAMIRAGYYPAHYVKFVAERHQSLIGKYSFGLERAETMRRDLVKMSKGIERTVDARRARFEEFREALIATTGQPARSD